jgi:hypothetical protein
VLGLDVIVQGDDYGSALQAASAGRSEAISKLLPGDGCTAMRREENTATPFKRHSLQGMTQFRCCCWTSQL